MAVKEKKEWKLLADWIAKEGITQKELADDLSVTEGAISHWINGRWTPEVDTLWAISRRTGFDIGRIMGSLPNRPEHAS